MSRVAKSPIQLPTGVEIKVDGSELTVKGSKGSESLTLNTLVEVKIEDGVARITPRTEDRDSWAMAGTFRALVNNMVVGVTDGFERKLKLIGVGYRVQVQGNKLNLTLGFSHPVVYELPEGVSAVAPTQTDIVLSGTNKQVLGQAAAEVRAFRPPEPYKGKGVRYADEQVRRKEAKKK